MSGIGQNRVFDRSAMEELKNQAVKLMKCASEVTEQLKEEMQALLEAAAEVPAEAAHPGLTQEANVLLASLDTEIYDTMGEKLKDILDKLCEQIPRYDSESARVLEELSSVSASLAGMLEELKSLIGQGSLSMSLEEFKGKLEEYEKKWEHGMVSLEGKMLLAMTYLKGLVLTSIFSRDPVNLSTGNFYYEKEDLKIHGILPLVFHRYYNAMDRGGSALGAGWSHSHGECLEKKGEELILHKADGKEITFRKGEEGYRDIHTGREELTEVEMGYAYREQGGHTLTFDAEGRLLIREDENGNRICYTHDEKGQMIKARVLPKGERKEEPGESFGFLYDTQGFLKEVEDHTGRKLTFFYLEGNLSEVTDPEGNTISYRYGENGKIRAVKNPRGILTVRNEYDEKGRIIRQRFPDKGEMLYAYEEAGGRTTLTERNGTSITYVQDGRLRNIRTIYHDGTEERNAYDDRDLRTSRQDRNGNTTRYAYDGKGNLTHITNALGQETHLAYNGDRKLTSVTICGREILKNRYDEKGRLTSAADALGRTRKTLYNEMGLAAAIIAPDGSRLEISYDKRGNITGIRDPYGAETSYRYDALNRVTDTTDGNGNTWRYVYDRKDRLIRTTSPEGKSQSYAYNESGKVTRITDFDGADSTIEYNSLNRPECLTDKEGRKTYRNYDLMWNISQETAPSGAVTRYHYDRDNRLTEVEICAGEGREPERIVRYSHDPNGNLLEAANAAPMEEGELSTVRYEYDALNRVTARVDAAGGRTEYEYDQWGNLVCVTDPAGNRSTFTYNEAGERISETDSLGNVTCYEYNALGQAVCITDPAGRKTMQEYGPGGRLLKTVYPDGRSVSYTYDKNGNIKTKENSDGYTLTYAYDCMNRVTDIDSSEGQNKHYEYDALGNVTSMTDANGNRTSYEYTLSGKLSAVTDALGNRAEYRYDATDRLIFLCQKGREGEPERVTEYMRDPLGRVETMRNALGMEEHYTYDPLGRMKTKTDRDGFTTTYSYMPDGKTASILYGDGTKTEMEYDALRKLALVKDWLGETKIERDSVGNPVRITDHEGRTVSYEWGRQGERKGITYPDGRKVSYAYDEQLRLIKMILPEPETMASEGAADGAQAGAVIRYLYDEKGRLSQKQFPEGLKTSWLYDERGQLAELVHEDGEGILDRYQYEYDLMGNKTAIIKERRGLREESGRYEYGYDALSRLISVSRDGNALRSYAYDVFSNRSSMEDYGKKRNTSYHYDAMNRLIYAEEERTGGMEENLIRTDYSYDNRGNLIREEIEGTLIHGYEYGAMNRLFKSWNADGQEAFYRYNGLGQRTGKNVNGRGEDYLLDLMKPYHNLLGIRKEESEQNFYFDWNVTAMNEKRKETSSFERTAFSGLHYYMQDELGSPLRVSCFGAEEGTLSGRNSYLSYGYDEYGNDLGRELEEEGIPNPYDGQGEEQPFGYTGYRYDEISGTYFAQAREYQLRNGRFTAEDVVKGKGIVPETLNQYNYCRNNSLLYVDHDGKDVWYFYDPEAFDGDKVEKEVEADIELLEEKYDTEVHTVTLNSRDDFINGWNAMEDGNIDAVLIYTHANNNVLRVDTIENKNDKGEIELTSNARFWKEEVNDLESKTIDTLVFLGCNTGLTIKNDNIATRFIDDENIHNIGMVIAADGSVSHKDTYFSEKSWFTTTRKLQHELSVHSGGKKNDKKNDNETCDGYKIYYYDANNNLIIEKVGHNFTNVVDLINKAEDKVCLD